MNQHPIYVAPIDRHSRKSNQTKSNQIKLSLFPQLKNIQIIQNAIHNKRTLWRNKREGPQADKA